MKKVYNVPLYYEIAFSFMNIKKQIDCFEKISKKYSIKPKRFLDIACGPSLQLREIAKRGYEAIGLDASREMLDYLKEKAKKDNLEIETIKADMYNFKLKKKADFAFIMLGSLTPPSNKAFLSHLNSVASSLNKHGIYFIQNNVFAKKLEEKMSWTRNKGGISVKTAYKSKILNPIDQIIKEELVLDVNDNGKKKRFYHAKEFKFITPQEFKLLIEKNNKFKFLGWYEGNLNEWFLNKPLEKKYNPLNCILLRKR
jgi:SAM-dependent methyltransferase